MLYSPQFKTNGEHNPDGNGSVPLFGWLKSPLLYGLHGSEIQILVSGGALDEDILDQPAVADVDFEERRTFDALPSGRLRVAGLDLIATQWPGERTHSAPRAFAASAGLQTSYVLTTAWTAGSQANSP
jgi:hypothetical protein